MSEEPMEKAVVARGRCVGIPDPTAEPGFIGREPDTNKELFAPGLKYILPGEEVELPRSEVKRLRGLGTLVDPNAPEPTIETGQSHRLTLK
jgi:hypothetical protein